MDVRWTHPFTCVIAGPTQSGKTEFVKRFVRHVEDMVTPVPTKIIWSYGEWQPAYQSLLDKADFVQGLPDLPLYSAEPLLLVMDDQMHGVDQRISSLFTKGSHHRNLSVIYIVQNLLPLWHKHPVATRWWGQLGHGKAWLGKGAVKLTDGEVIRGAWVIGFSQSLKIECGWCNSSKEWCNVKNVWQTFWDL